MKKIIRLELIVETEVDSDWYEDSLDDEGILSIETENYPEWIFDNSDFIDEKLTIRDAGVKE